MTFTSKESPRRNGTATLLNTVLAACLVLFVAGGFYFGYVFYSNLKFLLSQPISPAESSDEPGASTRPKQTPVWGKERVNVLLLGIDQRPDEARRGDPARTDTMIVVTLDPVSKTGGMLSIPRDLWVPIPGLEAHGIDVDRINTAHAYGDLYKYPGGGPALAKKTVEYNLGIPIHYYVRVDFRGFERLIDAIGGVDIDVERTIVDNAYPDDNYGIISITIPAGRQHMDGKKALQYVRTRHADNDFGRLRRQQKLLLAAREKALSLDLLPQLPALYQRFKDAVKTDLSYDEGMKLARMASEVDSKSIVVQAIDESMTESFVTNGGAQVENPKRAEIGRLIQEMFYPPSAGPVDLGAKLAQEKARIEVQNGTVVSGLAGRVRSFLEDRGFNIISAGTANGLYDRTTIVDRQGKTYTRQALARLLNIDPTDVRFEPNFPTAADIVVIVGKNYPYTR
ncbi:MAG: LCP family protein [Chloroflexota bacterium]